MPQSRCFLFRNAERKVAIRSNRSEDEMGKDDDAHAALVLVASVVNTPESCAF
jgi:hypothetical protein